VLCTAGGRDIWAWGVELEKKAYIKRANYPITFLDRPRRLKEFETSRISRHRHMTVVRLSALHTGRLYPAGYIPGTHLC